MVKMETDLLIRVKNAIVRNRRDKNIKDYYLKKMKNGKSYNAVFIDSLFLKAVLVFVFFLIVYKVGNNFLIAMLLSLFVFIVLLCLSYHIKKQQFLVGVKEINDDLGKKRIIKEISYYTNSEFVEYVKCVLESYYSTNFTKLESSDMDLIGRIDGKNHGIKCIRLPQDERVTNKEVKSFQHSFKNANLKGGILLTSSYFVDEMKNEVINNIMLMDLDNFLTIIKEVNMYPTKKEIEEHILSRHAENKRKLLSSREKVFTSHKIKRYLFLSLCLFLLSKIATYSLYYLIMSVVSILLGVVSLIFTIYNILNMKMKD